MNDSRRGFTLVELLVVIAIIGVLVALLLPAIQAAREASRRSHCTNNLKQITLAMNNFVSAKRHLPIGSQADDEVGRVRVHQWTAYLLPFLELGNLHERYDWKIGDRGPNFGTAMYPCFHTEIPVYQCPSDTHGFIQTWGWSRTNYVGCFSPDGSWVRPKGWSQDQGNINNATLNPSVTSGKFAVFNFNVKRTLKQITDGTSHTAAFSEVITGVDDTLDFRGCWPVDHGVAYTHRLGPNSTLPDLDAYGCGTSQKKDAPCASAPSFGTAYWAARSMHPGGVHCALVDGSVQFVANEIDDALWKALGSMNGGEQDTSGSL